MRTEKDGGCRVPGKRAFLLVVLWAAAAVPAGAQVEPVEATRYGQACLRIEARGMPWQGQAEPPLQPGVVYVFFNQSDFQRPAETGVQRQIRMETQGDDFGWLWLGQIRFPQTAEVCFSAKADDGLRLMVGDTLIIDGPGANGAREGRLQVTAGQTLPLRLEYYQRGGAATLQLYWQWDGHAQEIIPASALFHDQKDVALAQALHAGRSGTSPGEPLVIQAPSGDEADCSSIYQAVDAPLRRTEPIQLGSGPYLFLDEYLIDESHNLQRHVNRPVRDPQIPNPLITGKEDECNGPYMTVLRDSDSGTFRIWYNTNKERFKDGSSHVAHMQSEDGIHWVRPHHVLADAGGFDFGSSVIDEGPDFLRPAERYKLAWWHGGGLRLAISSDGLTWTAWRPYPVIRHNHDITNIFYDAARKRYLATISVYTTGPTWTGNRRCTMHTASSDLLNWQQPWYVLRPNDSIEPGQTQFYAMNAYLQRGELLIGLVKVLHDDWRAPDTPEGAYGVGYTTLAWSHDGQHWTRDLEPFFEPDPSPEAWDHAHTWIDQQLPMGDQVYLYYGGYKFGHKMDRWEGRQIGLVTIQRDRYVSRDAALDGGRLVTPALVLPAGQLTVNANVRGELRLALLDQQGRAIAGCSAEDCQPIRGDSLSHAVHWKNPPSDLERRGVRIEFQLHDGQLYGFDVTR